MVSLWEAADALYNLLVYVGTSRSLQDQSEVSHHYQDIDNHVDITSSADTTTHLLNQVDHGVLINY